MGDVSGYFSYTTLFPAHVLPDFGRYFQPPVPCVAKHLFCDRSVATTKTTPTPPLKEYGKHCRYPLLYGNSISRLSAYVGWLHACFV